ncbi:MAG: class I tRNA ligase family protein, partial [Nitrospirota bacterium]|nr:class I tRNA ligase family protein [Nitrospirota bacterium]
SMASPGRDIKLAEERIEGYRNFATKIWNAARFIQLYAHGPQISVAPTSRPFPDRWILSRLNHTIREVTKAFEDYRFDQAASYLYQFIWHEYCDWYIELAKSCLQQENHPDAPATRHTLLESFEVIQRLLHPVMPFITEEIWQSFPHEGQSIMTQPFPTEKREWANAEAEQAFSLLQSFINTVRTARALLNISPSQTPFVYGKSAHDQDLAILTALKPYIEALLRSSMETGNLIPPPRSLQLPSGHFSTIGIPIPTEIDLQQVVKKVQKQIGEKEKEVQRLESRLSSPDFREKAEASVIQESEDRRAKIMDELDILNITEQQLASMTA